MQGMQGQEAAMHQENQTLRTWREEEGVKIFYVIRVQNFL